MSSIIEYIDNRVFTNARVTVIFYLLHIHESSKVMLLTQMTKSMLFSHDVRYFSAKGHCRLWACLFTTQT